MKTLFNSLLVALLLVSVGAQAETSKPIVSPKKAASFQSALFPTAEGKVQIALDKQAGGKVVVRLKNSAGTELFTQQIGKRQQAARLRLDVSSLPDGVYQVEISNGVDVTTQEIMLTTQQPHAPKRVVAIN